MSILSMTMSLIFDSFPLRVLTKREGDVVEQGHRPEQRTVLEQHPEHLPDLMQVLHFGFYQVGAVDHDRAGLRFEQADQTPEEDGFPGSGRAEQHADLPGRDREAHVVPDVGSSEGLREALDDDLGTSTHFSTRFLIRFR
jgi:hypothetical protein